MIIARIYAIGPKRLRPGSSVNIGVQCHYLTIIILLHCCFSVGLVLNESEINSYYSDSSPAQLDSHMTALRKSTHPLGKEDHTIRNSCRHDEELKLYINISLVPRPNAHACKRVWLHKPKSLGSHQNLKVSNENTKRCLSERVSKRILLLFTYFRVSQVPLRCSQIQ